MAIQAKKATRRKLFLKMALIGPSGSGKTYSALKLAKGIGGNTLLVNTEGDRGYIYADEFEYDIVDITPPFVPETFIEAIQYAEKEGYTTVIMDSASHEWAGRGGLLELHDSMPGNSYTNWAKITPRHNAFLDAMLYCKAHLIACLRGKDQYVLEEKNGKQVPKKVGLGAEQRPGFEYECQLTLLIEQDTHITSPMKDNTHIFDGKYEILTEKHGQLLKAWAEAGAEYTPAPAPAQATPKAAGKPATKQPPQQQQQPQQGASADAISEPQRKKIYAMSNKLKLVDHMKQLMFERYSVTDSKALTKKQATDLIDFMTKMENGEACWKPSGDPHFTEDEIPFD